MSGQSAPVKVVHDVRLDANEPLDDDVVHALEDLLEVDVCPSLSSSSPMDKRIKTTMLSDAFNLIGVQPYDRKKLEKEQESVHKRRLLGLEKGTRAGA